jgi:AraC-like DNA-binding protein
MEKALAKPQNCPIAVKDADATPWQKPAQYPYYTILFMREGTGVYHADFGAFPFTAPVLLFATPMQTICIEKEAGIVLSILQFHGDFYCIEYHRAEVACNGLLFNNVYLEPFVLLTVDEAGAFLQLVDDMQTEVKKEPSSGMVLRAYLQLFLAKCSSIKLQQMTDNPLHKQRDEAMERFRLLLEENFLTLHRPHDYAQLLAMSPDNFARHCMRYFHKTPSNLIHERRLLEAKKLLHLTRQSIKEIAFALNFHDEAYFSRLFKKFAGVSPQAFRSKVGISIVADLYRQ